MILIYVTFCIALLLIGRWIFLERINPVSIYVIPWLTVMLMYEIQLVAFYDLTIKAHLVILVTTMVFCVGTILGFYVTRRKEIVFKLRRDKSSIKLVSKAIYRRRMRNCIVGTTVIGIIPIIYSLFSVIARYGLSFINQVSLVYGERLNGVFNSESIPYIGSLFYVAIILTGIYYSKFGFEKFMVFPISIAVIRPFISGARQGLVQSILFIVLPIILNRGERVEKVEKRSFRSKVAIGVLVITLLVVFLSISNQRSFYINYHENNYSYNTYATPGFEKIIQIVPGIYQIYTYLASPVGVLSIFLENPQYSFGKNSLYPIYNVLNNIGFDIPVQQYQDFYRIPINANAGTAVRELIQDYTFMGAIIAIFLCGCLVGKKYRNFSRKKTVKNIYVISFLFMVTSMSWFMWFLRDANLILAFLFGIIVTDYIDSYTYQEMS